ncbi:MAG TPA: malto-oligosyltrehalose trehalohydrolase [Chloroflexia bacterium]|nr:malto-oligosyltrehalose trehalohydrolase [Chloroflexia bacterium]
MKEKSQAIGLGAEVTQEGVEFRVWAPQRKKVELLIEEKGKTEQVTLEKVENGYFAGRVERAGHGTLYRYLLDGEGPYPDPRSRFQPEGPHGPSMVVDPGRYEWHDQKWPAVEIKGQVIYEMHIGTFTPEGTFDAAAEQLAELKELGVTVLEVLPVADFAGRWNWGYDGVNLYAPTRNYGDAEAFKRFVDTAHAVGLAVILDVVYNHLGPDGNYLYCFARNYFSQKYKTDWGEAINFDGPDSKEVREYFIGNALYWVKEFHLDGLRIDATQSIFDESKIHILAELSQRLRETARPRKIILIGENEPQKVINITPVEKGGYGLDALWNDDFHHSARVALNQRHEGYFADYRGTPQEFISEIKRGFLYQGQYYSGQEHGRGTNVTDEPADAFVVFNQNHDQIGNTLRGDRILSLTSWGIYKTLTALMLLAPQTPMLFMGQEFGASTPFTFFVDFKDKKLNKLVYQGRKEFISQFKSFASPEAQALVPDPAAESTFTSCKLNFAERETHASIYAFHKDLLKIRREDPVIAAQDRKNLDGALLSDKAFVLRFFNQEEGDRLLLVNLGQDLDYCPVPEPLLAPLPGTIWKMLWTSEDPRYDGPSVVEPWNGKGWYIPGSSSIFLRTEPVSKK